MNPSLLHMMLGSISSAHFTDDAIKVQENKIHLQTSLRIGIRHHPPYFFKFMLLPKK